ncbi:MAG: gluconeogenesis factor YvcK family protein, partial [Candidatus Binatia bacterium]
MAIPTKNTQGAKVAVLGGGNGTSQLLKALLPLLKDGRVASLHALVNTTDDGGSTGRLREQYAVGALGDLTRCLLALSGLRGDIRGEKFLKALEYRFSSGDFKGHTLRNALLAALEITSDIDAAIATFARVLQVPKYAGVIPITLKPLTQQVEIKDDGKKQV